MLVVFLVLTMAFLSLSMVAADRLYGIGSVFRFGAVLAASLLIAGAIVWLGMIASPAVIVVSR